MTEASLLNTKPQCQAFACLLFNQQTFSMEKPEIRRQRLRTWFADRTLPEKEKSYLSQLMSGTASFGEKAARRLEQSYGMPTDWLDSPLGPEPDLVYTTASGTTAVELKAYQRGLDEKFVTVPLLENALGAGSAELLEYDAVEGELAFQREWILKKGWRIQDLRILNVKGDSQAPFINDGDVVMVNVSIRRLFDGKFYAIRMNDEAKVKKLFRQMDGRIRVESLNAPTDYITAESPAEILGMVVHRAGVI
jgi:phage repressor protein C with HTH and peptisase S24 domain